MTMLRLPREKHGSVCHPKLTQTALILTARRLGFIATVDNDWDEIRVYPKGRGELAYGTDDLGDAWNTLHAMHAHSTTTAR